MARPERSILIAAALILMLVVAAVIVGLTVGSRGPDQFPAGSPAAVLQQYLAALRERDVDTALGYLSTEARQQIERQNLPRPSLDIPDLDQRRIAVNRLEEQGERATLYVTVESFQGSGLDADRYRYERQIPFVNEGGSWKIDEVLFGL